MKYAYADAYLARLVTSEREDRATADVAALGALPAAWVARLIPLRVYVLTCLECQQAPDDLFGAKLPAYRREFEATLTGARAAQDLANAAAGTPSAGSAFTVELFRA